jgi:hypothetical protein
MIVYSLVESDYEGAFTHSIYETKRAAYKSMLLLIKKRATEALDFYRLTGDSETEYCYRNHSSRLTVCEEHVWSEDDLLNLDNKIKPESKATTENLLELVKTSYNKELDQQADFVEV